MWTDYTKNMEKEKVKAFWDSQPCGTRDIPHPEGSVAWFDAITRKRYKLEPFISKYARFDQWYDKKVLEIGCGVGTDLFQFVKAEAKAVGIDLSPRSVSVTKQRFQISRAEAGILIADAENLPFKDNEFDLAYSWGVLHHTPNPEKAVQEIYRVTRPGGQICVMLYHRYSLVALQLYLRFGLFSFKPFRSLKEIISLHQESPGTKAYTITEARQMFSMFKPVEIEIVLTPYDLRYWRDRYLPRWVGKLVPEYLGWFIIIQGQKPQEGLR